jgi:hypothetical protein
MSFGRKRSSFRRRMRFAPAAAVLVVAFAAGCSDNTSPTSPRAYNQLQRLGNPLVSEVLLMKRNHPLHGSIGPDQDVALVRPEVTAFLTDVAGRTSDYAATIAGVVTPDMLVVQTGKDPATAGWLSWALSDGWGGRKLDDDVVDLALTAVFGSALGDAAHATPALTSDNVGFDSPTTATFPYLGAAN